jgi:peptidoglycan lytic transglycosylase D
MSWIKFTPSIVSLITLICSFSITLYCGPTFAGVNSVWTQMRQSFNLPHHRNQQHVKKQIEWIRKHPHYIQELAKRSTPYIYYILTEVKKRNMPGEIALLPMIESAYNPFAHSVAGAAGLWQLMPGTGTGLGLRQDWWYDGRRDIHASTNAALKYLGYLSQFFDKNWILAIAAYDSGEGTVQRAINKNKRLNYPTNFWSLHLPRETKAYIPRLLALAEIIKYPRYYGVKLPEIAHEPYFKRVDVGSQIDLKHAAKLAQINYALLIKLNPGYNRWTTGPAKTYKLVIPVDKVERFKQNLITSPSDMRVSWQRHQVRIGDTLSDISDKYHTSVTIIKKINKLSSDNIRDKQILLIPGTLKLTKKSLIDIQRQKAINKSTNRGPIKIIHIVQRGDSLSSIEKKYHVKTAAIRFWNKISTTKGLAPGNKIILWIKKSTAKTYRVKPGDNLSTIAHRHHISLKKLLRLNPEYVNKLIKPKQVLKLA